MKINLIVSTYSAQGPFIVHLRKIHVEFEKIKRESEFANTQKIIVGYCSSNVAFFFVQAEKQMDITLTKNQIHSLSHLFQS